MYDNIVCLVPQRSAALHSAQGLRRFPNRSKGGVLFKQAACDDLHQLVILLRVDVQHGGILHHNGVAAVIEKGLRILFPQGTGGIGVDGGVHIIEYRRLLAGGVMAGDRLGEKAVPLANHVEIGVAAGTGDGIDNIGIRPCPLFFNGGGHIANRAQRDSLTGVPG